MTISPEARRLSYINADCKAPLLITGGEGFIGGNFLKLLSSGGFSRPVISVDLNNCSQTAFALHTDSCGILRISADICNYDDMVEVIETYSPQTIIHFAAETHVDKSIDSPLLFAGVNYMGTATLLEAARRLWQSGGGSYGRHRFVYVSTDEVYGSHASVCGCHLFDEGSKLFPSSPYAASKAAGDLLALAYRTTYDFPVIITRSSNNYGPAQLSDKLIPKMIGCALRHEPLPIYGNGSNVRDWLYVDDHCEALRLVAEHGSLGEVYNICGGNELSNVEMIKEVLRICREETGDPQIGEHQIMFVGDRRGHDLSYSMSAAKIRSHLDWLPRTQLEQGLRETVRWYLEHPDWISANGHSSASDRS